MQDLKKYLDGLARKGQQLSHQLVNVSSQICVVFPFVIFLV